jgi:hypothetical protein
MVLQKRKISQNILQDIGGALLNLN